MSHQPTITPQEMQLLVAKLGFELPQEYTTYLAHENRNFIKIDKLAYLCGVDELLTYNAGYNAEEQYPGYFLIGSDGSLDAFAIEKATQHFVLFPFIQAEHEEVTLLAQTWKEFLHHIRTTTE